MASEKLRLDEAEFLRCYSFTQEEFGKTGLNWTALEQMCVQHIANIPQLQTTADYISQRLRQVAAVHSLKVRIKHPEHLIAKVIRKKIEKPDCDITLGSYNDLITDLIGIRALHLFKDEWKTIHEFVTQTWELREPPIAYVREGDLESVLATFRDCGCTVQEHPFGYRSVHYLLKSTPAKQTHIAELQVRTLFEEGWSEIDHQVRYPRQTSNPHLAEFLTIFNRLAGSADEMGTFIKALSRYVNEQAFKLAEKENQLSARERELKKAISELKISTEQKQQLETQVEKLRESLEATRPQPFFSIPSSINALKLSTAAPSVFSSMSTVWSPDIILDGLPNKLCTNCGKSFRDDSVLSINDKCPACRGLGFLGR